MPCGSTMSSLHSSVTESPIRAFLARYDRRSAVTLALLIATYAFVAVVWRRYIDLSQRDFLLVGIWLFMTALMCWDIQPRRDAIRALVGFGGGMCIEAWGTVTELWWYFTAERPPLWILPAWPVASIAIDRLSRAVDLFLPTGPHRALWWAMLPPFVAGMTAWIAPYLDHPFTIAAVVAMAVVLLWPGDSREDVRLMIAGSALGIFLEYWGTSRHCWNYYTLATPPIAAVFAHGFAAVSFQRVAAQIDNFVTRERDRP
jgi:hypothetical protein